MPPNKRPHVTKKKKNHFSQPVSVSHTVKHEQQFKNMSGNTSPPAD